MTPRQNEFIGRQLNSRKANLIFAMTSACGVPGGVATANLNILHALVDFAEERGLELTVLSFLERDTDRPQFLPDWISFRAFQGNKSAFALNVLYSAFKKPIYFFDYIGLALPVLPLAAANFVKTIIFAHGQEYWRSMRRTDRWSIRAASLCLTNSHYTLRKMRENLSHFIGEACPLGLSPTFTLNKEIPEASADPIEFQASDGMKCQLGDRVILLVARMHPNERQKGHRALLEILPSLLEKYPDVQLVFPGPGDDRENLKQLAQRKGVASSVFLPGFVSVRLLERLYRHCYAFVMPSKQEGFGLAYLEAMNYGKPCVGCFDQGAEDVIVHGETGYLVHDPRDSTELIGVLYALLDNPVRARSLGKAGFERLHSNFTSEHFQARIKKQVGSLLYN